MESIKIENLRSLENTGEISLKPLVVLLGKNSSGKSTFLRTFPLLKQSIETSITEPILWYSEKSVDFGDFETSLHKSGKITEKASDKSIAFEFKFKESPDFYFYNSRYSFDEHIDFDFKLRVEVLKKNFRKIIIETMDQTFEIFSSKSEEKEPKSFILSINNEPLNLNFYQENGYQFHGNQFLPNIFPHSLKNKTKNNEIRSRQFNQIFLNYIIQEIKDVFNDSIKDSDFLKIILNDLTLQKNSEIYEYITEIEESEKIDAAYEYFHRHLDDFVSHLKMNHLVSVFNKDYSFYYNNPFNFAARMRNPESAINNDIENIFLKMLNKLSKTDQNKINQLLMASYWTSLVDICNENLFNYFSRVQYIAPIRASAQRYYRSQGLAVNEIDPQGENIPMAIKNMSEEESVLFRDWTKQNFEFEFFTEKEGGHISLQIKFKNNEVMNLTDTGFGFSQILPIVLLIWRANYSLNNNEEFEELSFLPTNDYPKTIVIEQPELHLHPNLQAKLCEVIVKCISLYNENSHKTRIIIETHSDTIINKLGQLIFEEKLDKESVNILAFGIQNENEEKNISIKNIPFDENGLFEEWPTDFLMEDF